MALRSPTHTFSVLTAHNPRVSGEKARAHFFPSLAKAQVRPCVVSYCALSVVPQTRHPPSVTSPTAATQLPPLDQTCVVNRPADDRTGLGSAMMLTNLPPRSPPGVNLIAFPFRWRLLVLFASRELFSSSVYWPLSLSLSLYFWSQQKRL